METNLKTISDLALSQIDLFQHIEKVYKNLTLLPDFTFTAYGPTDGSDDSINAKSEMMTGARLKAASTNSKQGLWLAKLAMHVTANAEGHINVLELGTAAGISGMYLLAGIAPKGEGRLISFEGSPELAKLAEGYLRDFVSQNTLHNIDFEIIVGNFDNTLEGYIKDHNQPIHLAFIDGNHREDATIHYHELVRNVMGGRGVIVHDDISWSANMTRAWQHIQQIEGAGKTAELYLGNLPSRGIVFLDGEPNGEAEIVHLDGIIERLGRQAKRILK